MNLNRPIREQGQNSGNALIYVLLALALLAALTMLLMRQGEQGGGDISDEQAQIYAAKLINYSMTAKTVVDQMRELGVTVAQLDINGPGGSSFNTPPHANKIFHPDGGGLVYFQKDPKIFPPQSSGIPPGWYFGYNSNVEWTPTTAVDFKLTAYRIDRAICAAINEKITGSKTIPALPSPPSSYFIEAAATALVKTDCPACDGYPTLCVSNTGATDFAFYAIIAAQ